MFVRWKKIIILAVRFWWQTCTFRMAKPLETSSSFVHQWTASPFWRKRPERTDSILHNFIILLEVCHFVLSLPQPHLDSDCGFSKYSFEPCLAGNAVAQFSLTTLIENWPKTCRPSAARVQTLTQRRQDQTPWNIVNLYHEAPWRICRAAS